MRIYRVDEQLPPENTFVVCRYTGGNWKDKHHQQGVVWKVAKFVKAEIGHNNQKPYRWDYGTGYLFGQDVDVWFELPTMVP